MKIKEGEELPNSEFFYLDDKNAVKKIDCKKLFENGKAILLGVPGAFTKTCSTIHLPGYVKNFDLAKQKGIEKIVCIAVNDPNVMKAWGEAQSVGDAVEMLADGNGEFARATGLTLDASGFGLGERSTRFSMIVDDGKLIQLNVESNPSEMDVSSAEHMLGQL